MIINLGDILFVLSGAVIISITIVVVGFIVAGFACLATKIIKRLVIK